MKRKWMMILISLVIAIYTVFVFRCLITEKKSEDKASSKTPTVTETENLYEQSKKEPSYAFEQQNVVNIMLVGQDRRQGQSANQRSDSMILVTLNRTKKSVAMTSFMRDTYIAIPGRSGNRLNAAYAFGGMELLDETITYNFDIHVDANIEVDFYDFIEIIDAVGGVDVEVKDKEVSYINKCVHGVASSVGEKAEDHYVTTGGMQHLDGIQTLSYCRIRYVGNADFERTQRQRRVLQELFANMKAMDALELLDIMDQTFALVNTDLSTEDVVNLMLEILAMDVSEVTSHNIPEDAGYSSDRIRGMSVLVPDIVACKQLLQEIVNE